MRIAIEALLVAAIGFGVLLFVVRLVVLPRIEANRAEIEGVLSKQIGQPVEIASLATGWNGWNPRLDIRDLRILDSENGSDTAVLPETHLTVSWTSVLFMDLRLKDLTFNHPRLGVRRDDQGLLHVAGMTIDPSHHAPDKGLIEWVLRQPRITIRDAEISWRDELVNASEVTIEHVELRAENRFGHYRFGLTGVPPAEMAAPLDLRGELTASSPDDWRAASGRLYARLDYADIAAWHDWLPSVVPLTSGKGALRLWVELERGEPRDVVTDLVLTDVHARLDPDLPELALSRLEGRLGWSDNGERRDISARQLSFAGPGEFRLDPTDFKSVTRFGAGGAIDGSAEITRLELEPLRQIAASLPLPTAWRDDLARWAPRGRLENVAAQWTGDVAAPTAYAFSARLSNVGVAPQDKLPGFASVSGELSATQGEGVLKLASQGLAMQLPVTVAHVAAQNFVFDHARGEIRWHRQGDLVALTVDQLAFDNADVAAVLSGQYEPDAALSPNIKLDAQLTRADLHQLYRYVPGGAESGVREWLRKSLVSGVASDGRVKIAGRLADFPFADARKGQFQATVKARGATLDYATQWPALSALDADVKFDGPRLSIEGRGARIYGVAVSRVLVDIADLRLPYPLMRVDGEAAGATSDFLKFVSESPVDGWLDHALHGAEADGDGRLTLKLEMPIGHHEGDQVSGEYTFNGDRLRLAGGIPELSALTGKLAFSQNHLSGSSLTAQIIGGPAQLSVNGRDGRVDIDGKGTVNLDLLRTLYPQQTLATRVAGTTDWRLALRLQPDMATWTIDSTLVGASVDLPLPAAKLASGSVPLHIERRRVDAGSDALAASYGGVGRLIVQRRLTAAGPVAERALLTLGKARGEADRQGLWIRGDVDALDLDAWLALKAQAEQNSGAIDLPLSGFDLNTGVIQVLGKQLHELHMAGTRVSADWQVDLRGRELEGNAHWQAPGAGRPNGRIVAHLQRLTPPAAATSTTAASAATTAATGTTAAVIAAPGTVSVNSWPALDIVAETFRRKERDLGKLELLAQPRGSDWRIESLKLSNPDGTLTASGWWRGGGSSQQTVVDTELDVNDAGKFLARFEMPDSVRGAATKIRGQMSWAGSPQDFDYPTLNGKFRIETSKGQFTKLDPGLGKLLGVLSLQAMKRRLTFDFQDLFGEGFAFDEISGDVRVQDGVMHSDNLRIVGPSARVGISGEADLAHETQQLRVRVQPTLSAGVSMGAAALLLANPLVGVAVAAGSLIAQRALQDPIEQMFSYEYAVSGSWADPIVERGGRTPAAPPPVKADAGIETRALPAPPTITPAPPTPAPAIAP